jgi:hypothetical protein
MVSWSRSDVKPCDHRDRPPPLVVSQHHVTESGSSGIHSGACRNRPGRLLRRVRRSAVRSGQCAPRPEALAEGVRLDEG